MSAADSQGQTGKGASSGNISWARVGQEALLVGLAGVFIAHGQSKDDAAQFVGNALGSLLGEKLNSQPQENSTVDQQTKENQKRQARGGEGRGAVIKQPAWGGVCYLAESTGNLLSREGWGRI